MAQRRSGEATNAHVEESAPDSVFSTLEEMMRKDRKRLPLSGNRAVVPFLATVCLKAPLLAFGLLPAALTWKALSAPFTTKKVNSPCVAHISEIPPSTPLTARPYDIVLVGATGFTGRLTARYLAKQYGTSVKWAIAGRQPKKLEDLKAELCTIDAALKDLPIIIADTLAPGQLPAITDNTRVVLSTVGPFEAYGTPLVKSCALYGTSYCDITGEYNWTRKTIDQFDEVARHTGARLVHFCGYDCIPADLVAQALAAELKKKYGEALARIDYYNEMKGEASGATVQTMAQQMEAGAYTAHLGFDPLLKTPEGTKATAKLQMLPVWRPMYSPACKAWVGPFLMAGVNFNAIRRSNAINAYGTDIKYNEALVFPSMMAAVSMTMDLLLFACLLVCKPLHFLLPKPGQGPSEHSQATGYLRLTAHGTGEKGSQVKATLYYPSDVGYSSTARMLAEAGLALLDPTVSPKGGVLTPATCQGPVLLKRLVDTGCWYHIE